MLTHLRFHPSEMMLHRYAEGTLRSTTSLWVKRHLASCYECRGRVSFTRSLREALTTLPSTIPMDSALIARVMAERRDGQRAVLPTSDADPARIVMRSGWLRALTVAAAAILLVVVVGRARQGHTPQMKAAAPPSLTRKSSPASSDEFAVSEFFLPKSAFAREPLQADSSAPPLILDGGRLRPDVVRYARFERVGGDARRRIGTESIELTEARIEGRAAWRVVQRRQIADTQRVETLYADRATLQILGRTIRVQPYMHYLGITVRQRVVGDSLTGWMQTDSGLGRPIARHLSPRSGPYLSDALAPVLLGATTLGPGWRGQMSILGWAVRDGDVSFPARLRVVGEERVRVPAGTFECWKIAVDASVGMQTYWVRQSDGVGVRALLEREGAVRELVLTR
jgi:hypothetical protein